jgi:transposase
LDDFLDYPSLRVVKRVIRGGVCVVDADVDCAPKSCSKCGSFASFLQKHGIEIREVTDMSVRDVKVVIRFHQQRFLCLKCNRTTVEPLPGVEGKKRMTSRLAHQIGVKATMEPFTSVAKENGLSEKTIRKTFGEYARLRLEDRSPDTPHSLGIADVYVARVARCVLVNNDTKRLYELLPSRKQTSLYRFLLKIPGRHQIRVVTIDMCAAFRDAIRKALPNAVIVVDCFHIQSMANRAIKRVARSKKPRRKPGKAFARDPFLLLREPDDLSEEQVASRDLWLMDDPLVCEAYRLKKTFLSLWRTRDRGQAEAAYCDWLTQIPCELKDAFHELTTAMQNWSAEVFNYWDHRYTNAICESHNRLIKDIQRRGQSYEFKTVRAKALLRDILKHEGPKIA